MREGIYLGFLLNILVFSTSLAQQPEASVYEQNIRGWDWPTPANDEDVIIYLMGDTNIQDRENPVEAFQHLLPTLNQGDLRFLNLFLLCH